jgi:hypothetical protein
MMVLGYCCKECNKICSAIYFQENFKNWTSGNDDIDKFIQKTQLSIQAHYIDSKVSDIVLEWIPYNRFNNIKNIEKIGVFKANWIDGYIFKYSLFTHDWERVDQNMIVTLKSLNDIKNTTLEFLNKV